MVETDHWLVSLYHELIVIYFRYINYQVSNCAHVSSLSETIQSCMSRVQVLNKHCESSKSRKVADVYSTFITSVRNSGIAYSSSLSVIIPIGLSKYTNAGSDVQRTIRSARQLRNNITAQTNCWSFWLRNPRVQLFRVESRLICRRHIQDYIISLKYDFNRCSCSSYW